MPAVLVVEAGTAVAVQQAEFGTGVAALAARRTRPAAAVVEDSVEADGSLPTQLQAWGDSHTSAHRTQAVTACVLVAR